MGKKKPQKPSEKPEVVPQPRKPLTDPFVEKFLTQGDIPRGDDDDGIDEE